MKFKLVLTIIIVASVGFIIFSKPSGKSTSSTTKPAAGNFSTLIGKPAPAFTLQDYRGNIFNLSQLKGKKIVLFFNEGIICYPACWNQVSALGTDEKFNNNQVIAASIVPDGPTEWAQATQRMPDLAKSTILLDSDNTVSSKYGTLNLSSSMHKGGKPGHTYVVIDAQGIVRYTYDDPKMGIQNARLAEELNKI